MCMCAPKPDPEIDVLAHAQAQARKPLKITSKKSKHMCNQTAPPRGLYTLLLKPEKAHVF